MTVANFEAVEIVWTLLNLIIFVVAGFLYFDARRTLHLVIASGENGLYRMAAAHDRRRFAYKLFITGAFVAAGLYAGLIIPPNPDAPVTPPISAYVTVILLIVADIGLLGLIVEDGRHRFITAAFLRKHGRPGTETALQVEDREVGDVRRALQVQAEKESNGFHE